MSVNYHHMRWPVEVTILVAAAAVVVVISIIRIPVDDSFIYLRIAKNIGTNRGWLYNVDEISNAATSTTYTLLLAAIGALIGYSDRTLAIAYGLSLYALILLQYVAWRTEGKILAVVIAAGTVLGAKLLKSFGMETALLMAFVSATALCYRKYGDAYGTGVLAGLTALTRPEGIILLGLIGLFEIVRRRRIAWRSGLTAALIIFPWVVFANLYFGTALSHTSQIKSLQRYYGPWARQPDFIFTFLKQSAIRWIALLIAVGSAWLAKCRIVGSTDIFAALCISFGIAQVLAYQIMEAPSLYPWYYVPGNFALSLAIILLSASVVKTLPRHFVALCLPTLPVIAAIWVWHIMPDEYRVSDEYRTVGQWLHEHGTPNDTFAAAEIGYLGWYSGLRVLDIHGLLHPRALPWLRQRNLHWWWDLGERPRYVVTHDVPWEGEPGSSGTWPPSLSADFFQQYNCVFKYKRTVVFEKTTHQ